MKSEWRKEASFFLLLVFLSGILLFSDRRGWLKPIRGVIEKPILALEEPLYSLNTSISRSLNFFSSWLSRDQEMIRLQANLRQMSVDQNKLNICLEENEHLRKLLGAPLSPQWKFLEAKVIGLSEKMRLNRGEKDGLRKGMVVINENILVGKIMAVGKNDSLVKLINDPDSKVPVVIKQIGQVGVQARGLLAGQFGGQLLLDRVLQNEDIQKNDLVVSSGEDEWPPDLLIGQIEEVLPRTAEVYQKAVVRPLIDYQQLRIVFVVMTQ
jgi:rod shape-determining protein MreC